MALMSFRSCICFLAALFWATPTVAQQTNPTAMHRPIATSELSTVKPGDQVVLRVWREPELSGTFTVAANGDVILPRLGAVRASNHTIVAFQDLLRRAYAEYLRDPAFEVTVLRRIGVHGEVNKPGLYLVDLTMTLRDVIAQAGGVTAVGDPNSITIVRGGQRIQFGKRQGAELLTAELVSGDQVAIGQRSWFERNSLAVVSTGAVVISLIVPVIRSIF
jgi:polysaccharide export outer membrane protein